MTAKIIQNADQKTFRPYSSTDECVLRSFGLYDHDNTDQWTVDQWREWSKSVGIRLLKPAN